MLFLRSGTVECIIRDRSDSGLRLVFKSRVALDPSFQIVAESLEVSRTVRLVWMDERQAGVTFA